MKRIFVEIIQITIVVAILVGVSYACKKNRFKKEDFLTELYDHKIAPEIQLALDYTSALQNAWITYSNNATVSNYEHVKSKYTFLADQMERISFYNLGDVSAIYVFSRFYKTTVDIDGLHEKYNSQETFTENNINGYVNTQKGVFALEYLLFSDTFKDSISTPKFHNFVNAQLAYLKSTENEYYNSWGVYKKNFIENKGEGVSDSYNIVVNRMIHMFEDIINKRISDPIDNSDPSLGVGFYADQALRKIKVQVQQLNDVYLGIGKETFNSVFNNVRKKNKKLANEITEKFEETITYGNAMNNEISYYISSDMAAMNTYRSLIIELLSYFKTDVQKELDIIITFGDTDGD